MREFDMEDFLENYSLNFELFQYGCETEMKVNLLYVDEKLGECVLYFIENTGLTESDLFWFFDEIEIVASINFSGLAERDRCELDEMRSERFVYLTDMFVESEYRCLGIGSLFMKAIEDMLLFMQIKNIYLVSAMYRDNNTPYRNESFYIKNKFYIINDTKNEKEGKMMKKSI